MRVLFVCMGNICRSPTAEGVFRKLVLSEAPDFEVEIDSAGTHAYHVGEPPDMRAQAAARSRGIEIGHIRARMVEGEDFEYFDLILAMDEHNLEYLHAVCPEGHTARLNLLMDYATTNSVRTVPDPYYGGTLGFERVLDLLEEAARGLLAQLRTIDKQESDTRSPEVDAQ